MAEGVGDATPTMSATAKVERAMRISILLLPGDAGRVVEQMLTPASLTIITGSLLLWAGSHAFGIGEFVDVILLCAVRVSGSQGASGVCQDGYQREI